MLSVNIKRGRIIQVGYSGIVGDGLSVGVVVAVGVGVGEFVDGGLGVRLGFGEGNSVMGAKMLTGVSRGYLSVKFESTVT